MVSVLTLGGSVVALVVAGVVDVVVDGVVLVVVLIVVGAMVVVVVVVVSGIRTSVVVVVGGVVVFVTNVGNRVLAEVVVGVALLAGTVLGARNTVCLVEDSDGCSVGVPISAKLLFDALPNVFGWFTDDISSSSSSVFQSMPTSPWWCL